MEACGHCATEWELRYKHNVKNIKRTFYNKYFFGQFHFVFFWRTSLREQIHLVDLELQPSVLSSGLITVNSSWVPWVYLVRRVQKFGYFGKILFAQFFCCLRFQTSELLCTVNRCWKSRRKICNRLFPQSVMKKTQHSFASICHWSLVSGWVGEQVATLRGRIGHGVWHFRIQIFWSSQNWHLRIQHGCISRLTDNYVMQYVLSSFWLHWQINIRKQSNIQLIWSQHHADPESCGW